MTEALSESLDYDLLTQEYLSLINTYQPNLSICWMFQKAMSVRIDNKNPAPDTVTSTLANTFSSMSQLGDPVIRPFLQVFYVII